MNHQIILSISTYGIIIKNIIINCYFFKYKLCAAINQRVLLKILKVHIPLLFKAENLRIKFELIPVHLSIKSFAKELIFIKKTWLGPVQRRLVNPVRSGRKQRQQIPTCCGKPGHQYTNPLAAANFVGIVVGFLNVSIIRLSTPAEPPPCRLVTLCKRIGIRFL